MAVRNSVHLTGFLPKSEKFIITYNENTSEPTRSYYRANVNVRRNYKNKEGNYDYDLIQITAFGHTANYLGKYAKHGDQLTVEGEVRRGDDYEKDGELVRGQLFVLVNDAVISSSGDNSQGTTTTAAQTTAPAESSGSPLKRKLFKK